MTGRLEGKRSNEGFHLPVCHVHACCSCALTSFPLQRLWLTSCARSALAGSFMMSELSPHAQFIALVYLTRHAMLAAL